MGWQFIVATTEGSTLDGPGPSSNRAGTSRGASEGGEAGLTVGRWMGRVDVIAFNK